jgi:hypothetical protein
LEEALPWDRYSCPILDGGIPVSVLGMAADSHRWHLEIIAPAYLRRLLRTGTGAWAILLDVSSLWHMDCGMPVEDDLY